MTIEHDCSVYHHEHGERALVAGDDHPGKGWHDTPAAAGLVNVGQNGPVWAKDPEYATAPAGPVEIPEDWSALHWKKQAALAKAISGEAPADVAAATAVIEAEIAKRDSAQPEA